MDRELAVKCLDETLRELSTWSYEQLAHLHEDRLSREVDLADGSVATVHAEVLDSISRGDRPCLLIPVEVWVGREVIWSHLFARDNGQHEVDHEVHSNPQ